MEQDAGEHPSHDELRNERDDELHGRQAARARPALRAVRGTHALPREDAVPDAAEDEARNCGNQNGRVADPCDVHGPCPPSLPELPDGGALDLGILELARHRHLVVRDGCEIICRKIAPPRISDEHEAALFGLLADECHDALG